MSENPWSPDAPGCHSWALVDGIDRTVVKAAALSSATLHEAGGKIGSLPSAIKPLNNSLPLCGRALPVRSPPGDNLWLHHAIYAARPGEILVVDVGQGSEFGYWGEIMAVAAMARQIAGLIINGGVRDSVQLVKMNFPVFASHVCIRGTTKKPDGLGSIATPIRMGEVRICRGDLVFGDADGVVVLPQAQADDIIDASFRRDQSEQIIIDRLRDGGTTLEIYNLPPMGIPSKQL